MRLLRRFHITLFFVFACQLVVAQSASGSQWKTLKTTTFSVQYPADWSLDQSGSSGTKFIVLSPLENPQDNFRENVNYITQNLAGLNLDLDKFVELSLGQIKSIFPKGNMLLSDRVKKSGNEYHHLIYTGEQGGYKLKFEQFVWVVNNQAHIITFTSKQSTYTMYKAKGLQVLNSFKLL